MKVLAICYSNCIYDIFRIKWNKDTEYRTNLEITYWQVKSLDDSDSHYKSKLVYKTLTFQNLNKKCIYFEF